MSPSQLLHTWRRALRKCPWQAVMIRNVNSVLGCYLLALKLNPNSEGASYEKEVSSCMEENELIPVKPAQVSKARMVHGLVL